MISILQPKFEFTNKNWLHFIPFFLSQSYAIVVYAAVMQAQLLPEKRLIASSLYFDEVKHLEEYLTLIMTLFYLFKAYKPFQLNKNWRLKNTPDPPSSELRFLKQIVIGLLFISLYTSTNLILNQILNEPYIWRWQLNHLMIAGLVYYMGLVGYKNSDLISQDFLGKLPGMTKKTPEIVDLNIIAKLDSAIETDKVHLNPKLSLQELAKLLEINESTLSNTINAHYQKNFRSFINEVRVEEVKHRLLHDGLANLSLLGVAKECGFNSEASFYRIFKQVTGSTPKQFLAAHSSDSHSQQD
ncbi:MAG: helix-turn-helix domain-containing protein [Bacteroidia bacterium]